MSQFREAEGCLTSKPPNLYHFGWQTHSFLPVLQVFLADPKKPYAASAY